MKTRLSKLPPLRIVIAILILVLMVSSEHGGMGVCHAQSCGGSIRGGQTVYGEISAPGQDCPYTFSGSASDVVTIRMEARDADLDPWLDLRDPNGSVVTSDDDSAGGYNSLITYTLRRSGTYTIVAGSYGGDSAGSFELSLSVGGSTTSCGGSIRSGQTVAGEIASPGEDCRYTFSGSAGDVVEIQMIKLSHDDSLDPWLDLLDPTGSVVTSDDDSAGGRNSLITHTLRRSGTYTIVAGSYQSSSAGRFELSLHK